MARRTRGTTKAKTWEYQVGEPPNTVTAYERLDRGRTIELRWWVGELKRFKKKSLGFVIRDERGVIQEDLQREAVRLTQGWYDALMAGRTPALEVEEETGGPLTLSAGFDLAVAVPSGMYVVETEHLREVRRAARDILWAVGTNDAGRPRTWDTLAYSAVRELWLRLAKRYAETGQGGPAWTERCVVLFLQVNQWLAVEEKIGRAVAVRKSWREQMRREWEQLTASRITRRAPRHSEAEIALIFSALDNPEVDPRIALAIELGAEARLGQVSRMMRSDVDLSPVGAFGLGRIVVHGSGKKLGVNRDLTPEERAAIDRALSGYLRNLEQAYRDRLRKDYPMFPSGRLRYDVPPSRWPAAGEAVTGHAYPIRRAKWDAPDQPIGTRTLTDLFHALERIAGVTPVEGRGWYGIRRKATDVYEDYESDERVLNDQTGHRNSETRRNAYQEREREEIRVKSAETRRRVRAVAFGRQIKREREEDEEPAPVPPKPVAASLTPSGEC